MRRPIPPNNHTRRHPSPPNHGESAPTAPNDISALTCLPYWKPIPLTNIKTPRRRILNFAYTPKKLARSCRREPTKRQLRPPPRPSGGQTPGKCMAARNVTIGLRNRLPPNRRKPHGRVKCNPWPAAKTPHQVDGKLIPTRIVTVGLRRIFAPSRRKPRTPAKRNPSLAAYISTKSTEISYPREM